MSKKGEFRTSIGGQALIEGVMMRGPDKNAMSVKTSDGIVTEVTPYVPLKEKNRIFGLPFVRGVVGFGSSMSVGVKMLMRSADLAAVEGDDQPQSNFDMWVERHFSSKTAENIIMTIALALGIMLPIGLFILLPSFVAGLFAHWTGEVGLLRNIAEGVLRILIFVIYLSLMTRIKDMRRTFMYHGAEHKSIHCYEAGLELTVENARAQPTQHPRCGTSFLFVVIIISTLVFSLFNFSWMSNIFLKMLMRLALLPVVVAISYEINSLAGKHDNALTRILRAPGLLIQNLTAFEPEEDEMLEIALTSLKAVLPEAPGADHY